jgi:hypothetical protein
MIKRQLFLELFLLIIIKLLLEYSYIDYVYKYFEYTGFKYNLNLEKYIVGWVIYIFGFFILNFKRNINLYIIFFMLYFIYILPNIVYFSLSNQKTSYFLTIILPYFIILTFTTNKKIVNIPNIKKGKPLILFISLISLLSVLIHLVISTHGHMVLNFNQVYDFREVYDKVSNSGMFGYLNNWVAKIFVVLLLAWSIDRKKRILTIVFTIAILFMFAFTGHKSVLEGIFLVFFFSFLFKYIKANNITTFILFSFFILIFLTLLLTTLLDLDIIASLVIRRLFFVPAQLNFVYFEYFDKNSFAYWGNSVLKYFIKYPYDTNIANVIGIFMGHPKENANTGFVASGFAQAGLIGVIIYTFILSIVINIINHFGNKLNKYLLISLTIIPMMVVFKSSDLLTAFLTHGVLIVVLTLWFYENKIYILKFKNKKYKI